MQTSKRIAVVGGGISGLSAAWILNKNGHSVTLFEKEDQAGGHTLTDCSGPAPVDLGFQVYNLTTYPHLVGFLESLDVETEQSDMSFALSLDGGLFEWASHGLHSIFAQRKNLFNPQFWIMIYQVIRFGQKAPEVLLPKHQSTYSEMTLGQYIEKEGYGDYFKKFYLLPMCAAVWSVPFETVLQFPVMVLVRFWVNHHLLDLFQRPVWRVVKGRSVNYVNRVLQDLDDVRLGCGVVSVQQLNGRVVLETQSGVETFDAVVMATHADVTLQILGSSVSHEEQQILKCIPYQNNDIYLHTDKALMPRLRSAWASWNFIASSKPGEKESPVCVSYWLNHLQNLEASVPPLFVTLNPPNGLPKPESVIRHLTLSHPIFSLQSMEAQEKLGSIQGNRGIYFAGAWCRYGFHEDGIRSSVDVTQRLGCSIPWTPCSLSPKCSLIDAFWLRTFTKFCEKGIKRGSLRLILPNGSELQFGDGCTEPANNEKWRQGPRLKATVRIFNIALFKKLVHRMDSGMAEAYMDADFAVDDFGSLMSLMAVNATYLSQHQSSLGIWSFCGQWLLFLAKSMRSNTIEGSRHNIKQHYDIGNELYKLFLDETMTYSSGIYTPSSSLHDAQLRKLDEVIRLLDIKVGDRVLEIGCGWGSFAIRAAQTTGCHVTGITLSNEQLREGCERVKAAGVDHLVQLLFCDYRHLTGSSIFDKVVSIEMIEAVGHEHLDAYFGTIGRSVKPGGKVFIQAITVPNERYADYCSSSDFIREHVFPGGHLPCMDVISSFANAHGMNVTYSHDIGLDYALTLRQWRDNWMTNKEALLEAGCDIRLHHMFEMYFAYCEAGFDTQYIHAFQITMEKTLAPVAPVCVEPVPTADHFTQLLLAIYFFLAGIVVTIRPFMWLTPLASAILVILFALSMNASSMFAFYRKMSGSARVWWRTRVVRCIYSQFMGTLSACHVLFYGLHSSPTDNIDSWSLMMYCAPVCITLGFCGFQVWNIVYHRLYTLQPFLLIRYTLMLMLLGVTAFKAEQMGLVTLLLLSEWNVFFDQLLQICHSIGIPSGRRLVCCLSLAEGITLLTFKVALQLAVLFSVVSQSIVFFSSWSYWLSVLCLSFSCSENLKAIASRGLRGFLSFSSTKEHRA